MQQLMEMKKTQIKQSNFITTARYDFSVTEKRIIYLIMQQLNGITPEHVKQIGTGDGDGLKLEINYRPLLEIAHVYSDNQSKNHEHIKKAVRALITRTFEFDYENATEGFAIICSYRIYKQTTIVNIQVPKMALKYFSELAQQYTNFNLFNALTLTSRYSQRLYEICSRYKDTRWHIIDVDVLRKQLSIPDAYTITDIKRHVLDVAKKELSAKTEFGFHYKEDKDGRKVQRFKIEIYINRGRIENITGNNENERKEIAAKLAALGFSDIQANNAAGCVPFKEFHKLMYDFNLNKSKIENHAGYLVSVIERKYGCDLSGKNPLI